VRPINPYFEHNILGTTLACTLNRESTRKVTLLFDFPVFVHCNCRSLCYPSSQTSRLTTVSLPDDIQWTSFRSPINKYQPSKTEILLLVRALHVMYNSGFLEWVASIIIGFPTFWKTLHLLSSGWNLKTSNSRHDIPESRRYALNCSLENLRTSIHHHWLDSPVWALAFFRRFCCFFQIS
jgi:hypothetical protein